MTEQVREIYLELWTLCKDAECPLHHRYWRLRESFEQIVREQMHNVALQATDLSARINYLTTQFSLENSTKNALHTFRLTSNDVLNHRKEPTTENFFRDVRSVTEAYRVIFDTPIPKELDEILPVKTLKSSIKRADFAQTRRIRVCFDYADEEFLYVHPTDEVSDECKVE